MRGVVQWTPDLSVGVEVLDFDHEVLLSLIDQLADAVAAEQSPEVVGSVLNMLADYTIYHFGREEAVMAACDYPGLAAHREIHADLRQRVSEIRDLYDANPGMVLRADLMDFLVSWLRDHILGHDHRYKPAMVGREADIAAASATFDATQPWSVRGDDEEAEE
jgi:hemerythrin-like metal-binding protein